MLITASGPVVATVGIVRNDQLITFTARKNSGADAGVMFFDGANALGAGNDTLFVGYDPAVPAAGWAGVPAVTKVCASGAVVLRAAVGDALYAGGTELISYRPIYFGPGVATPLFYHATDTTVGGVRPALEMHAQDTTVALGTGADFNLRPGHGDTHGTLRLKGASNTDRITVDDSTVLISSGSVFSFTAAAVPVLYSNGVLVKTSIAPWYWDKAVAAPSLYQERAAADTSGQKLTIQAQRAGALSAAAGTDGGPLALLWGDKQGTGVEGYCELGKYGSTFSTGGFVRTPIDGSFFAYTTAGAAAIVQWYDHGAGNQVDINVGMDSGGVNRNFYLRLAGQLISLTSSGANYAEFSSGDQKWYTANVHWDVNAVSPSITQDTDPGAAAVCENLTIRAQGASNPTGGASLGRSGHLLLGGGLGTVHADNRDGNVAFHQLPASWNSMEQGLFESEVVSAPAGDPVAGIYRYTEGGAGKARGTSGTITTYAPAGPHCVECGYDFWDVVAENARFGAKLMKCGWCGHMHKEGPATVLDMLTDEERETLV